MLEQGRVLDFFTSMSGEIFDRLTREGLLASIVEGEAAGGAAFLDGVAAGKTRRLGLGTLLFGARARVIRGELHRSDASSYIRGLLIGSEIADALELYPDLAATTVPLVGNAALSRLYASALTSVGVASRLVDSRLACLHGFSALHQARGT
jgi:2-dehydro-3-deoxygalactonokinase